jgi:hypothetical protein
MPDGELPPPAQPPGPPLPKRSKDGPRAPFGRSDDPLFGPLDRERLLFDDTFRGRPEPPLFGDAPAPERRVPDGPPSGGVFGRADRAPAQDPPPDDRAGEPEPDRGAPRPGRRRRPEEAAVDLPPASTPPAPPAPRPAGPTDPAGPTPPGPTPPGPGPAGSSRKDPSDVLRSGPPPSDFEPARLLHGTERDLLSQLQAELSTPERRPRPYRRAGRPGPTGTVNGHGHSPAPDGERPPPDMAG